jgi:23S rRNA-/tRNA-specific pseudouridylate synthase
MACDVAEAEAANPLCDVYQSRVEDGVLHISMKSNLNDSIGTKPQKADSTSTGPTLATYSTTPDDEIPETVLQYERQMRKRRAADKAEACVTVQDHLRLLFVDEHLVVTNKPSGILCVPGVNNNPCLLTLIHEQFGSEKLQPPDKMIVHRLDMDTSGCVIFGRTPEAVSALHKVFRERTQVVKSYEALVCGHVSVQRGLIDLPLQRDHKQPPFMRVATPKSEQEAAQVVRDLQHHGWKKLVRKKPKPSQTEFTVVGREYYAGTELPVTRLLLKPITGR